MQTSLKGSVIVVSSRQSLVRQMRTVLSSDCEARYLPTGSQVTPFTRPECPRKVATCSRIE